MSNSKIQTRYIYSINNFYGVDYSSPKLLASNYRSVDSSNFIRRDNVLQKRFGVKQVYDFKNSLVAVRNVWHFEDLSGNNRYIANVSGSLYEINKDTLEFSLINGGSNAVLDKKVDAFPANNRLYILGGRKYLVLYEGEDKTLKINEVVGSNFAYIPTTTIGIVALDAEVTGQRQTLDRANLLTYWKRNRCVSGTHYESDNDKKVKTNVLQEFKLDSSISYRDISDLEKITVEVSFFDNDNNQFNIDDNSSARVALFNTVFCKGLNLNGVAGKTSDELVQEKSLGGIYILVHYGEGDFNDSFKDVIKDKILSANEEVGDEQGFKIYGYITLSGSIILFNDYANSNMENNVVVTYPCYNKETYETNYIDTCFIGKVYNSNNINSLFVAGNPTYPARDWHTEEINASTLSDEEINTLSTKDLVYFPDTSYCDYGENNKNPILGYDVLGTGDLLVMKKYQNYEPTIYFRTGQLVSVVDDYGKSVQDLVGVQLYKPEYSLTTGNIGNSLKDYGDIVNFNGDTVFIANNNQIMGLDKETKSYDNQRYANTRSFYIDQYLKNLDLSKAEIYEDSEFLYFLNKSEMFVAKYGDMVSDSNQYERYHLKFPFTFTNIFKLENKTYVADNAGRIFLLKNRDVFYDEIYIELETGEFLIKDGTNEITIAQNKIGYIFANNTIVLNAPLLCSLGVADSDYYVDLEQMILVVINNKLIPTLKVNKRVSINNKEYTLEEIDQLTYKLKEVSETQTINEDEEEIPPINAYLLIDKFIVESVDYTNSIVKVSEFKFVGNQNATGRVYNRINVEAHYLTSPMLYDNSYQGYYKNIWKFTIANDTGIASEISIDLVDNLLGQKDKSYIVSSKDNRGYNLANLRFEQLNLSQNLMPVKTNTIYRPIYKKEYVAFNFFNNNNTNAVLSRISFEYSIGTPIF